MKDQDGKSVGMSEGFPNKERAHCHSQCIEALEKSELDFTAICLWKFQAGASGAEVVEKGWSECGVDSEGVV